MLPTEIKPVAMRLNTQKDTANLPLNELSLSTEWCELFTAKVFPHCVLHNFPKNEIRVWITGCISGMEAYALGLCWSEFIRPLENKINLRIFSSDLNSEKINNARLGKFERNQLEQLPKGTIDRYFSKEGTIYSINKEIRQWCVFAEHNTISNPPFQKIDLILCGHLINHNEATEQNGLFRRLYYAINGTGLLLFLYADPGLIPPRLFKAEDEKPIFSKVLPPKIKKTKREFLFPATSIPAEDSSFDDLAKKELLKHTPPGFIVNSAMDIVRFYGSTSLFFQPSSGGSSYQLTRLIRHEIAIHVFRRIQRLKRNNTPAKSEQVRLGSLTYEIDVSPFKIEDEDYYLVVIKQNGGTIKNNSSNNLSVTNKDPNQKRRDLRNKLAESQEDMFALKEEYESTNEELRSAYEEIVSANEELQSINGELESSKYQLEEANKNLLKTQHSLIQLQQKLQLALRAGSVATWSMDLLSGQLSWSPDHERIYGIKSGFFKGDVSAWLELIHPEDMEKVNSALQLCKKKWAHFDEEFRIIQPDRKIRWVMCKGEIIPDEPHRKTMIGISVDVTERNESHAKLLESERRFEFVSNHAPVMIWMADENQRIVFTNDKVISFTGLQEATNRTNLWLELIHEDDRENARNTFLKAFEEKNAFEVEYRFRRYDGEYRWIVNQGIPRLTQTKEFIGFIGIFLDITDRVESQNQKDDFIAIASHELKTPVTSLKSYAEILQMKLMQLGNENLAEMFMRMNNQIDKLSQLMNKLLDVTKIENGNLEFYKEEIGIRELVTEVCEEIQRSTDTHKINLRHETTALVWADHDRIAQVLSNLIWNAIKYSPENNTINVTTEEEENEVMVSVQDFGPGISFDEQENIFTRFYRTRNNNARIAGLGLGLFISHEIITKHEGKIWVTSTPGQGATFTFKLPKK